MAIGLASDMKVYDEQFQSGYTDTITRNVDGFNAASAGAITQLSKKVPGAYLRSAFLNVVATLVSRRDITAATAATALKATQAEAVAVKLHRTIGPVDQALSALNAAGMDMAAFSFLMGQQVAKAQSADALDATITSLRAALAGLSGGNDVTADGSAGTITHSWLVKSLAKFGDRGQDIKCWVMHSKAYYDLMGQAITDKITNVADAVIYGGVPATLGRPVLVTDSASLLVTGSPDIYHTLGLVEGAAACDLGEEPMIVSQVITGLLNLVFRMQGEHALVLGVKGFAWDVANGGANPSAAALGTSTNWDLATSDRRLAAGVLLKTQ